MMRMFLLILCLYTLPAAGADGMVVVVNQKIGVNKMTRDEVINVFLGRSQKLSSGVTALPLDLPGTSADRELFYYQLTGKKINEINAYWARLIFSGRSSPPTQVGSQEEAMQMVIDNRSAVAYVRKSKVSSLATVVFELDAR